MLVELLERDAIPMETLHARYGPVLQLVRRLLGVVPNCDPYLEIWPPAFRTYNVMVPNLLNLPLLLWGLGAPRSSVGIAMYVSSRTAGCAYCSAHACTFALRRGATVDEIASALENDAALDERDRAVVRLARALSRVPAAMDEAVHADIRRHFTETDIEWLVVAIAMMGWLNKTMDALGIPLEEETVSEVAGVISPSGWKPGKHLNRAVTSGSPPKPDSLVSRLSVIRHAPAAVALDRKWTKGVPDRWPAVGNYLRAEVGHSFPVLGRLRSRSVTRAIATMIRENLSETVIGTPEKLSAGLIYTATVGNSGLAEELRLLGAQELPESPVQALARAISSSPAAVDENIVETSRVIPPAGIVELVSFVAVLQMLHRLSSFFDSAPQSEVASSTKGRA